MNLDFLLLFSDVGSEKLRKIYDEIIWRVKFDEFLNIYHETTKEKYNFLYIEITENIFRKNFNELIITNN